MKTFKEVSKELKMLGDMEEEEIDKEGDMMQIKDQVKEIDMTSETFGQKVKVISSKLWMIVPWLTWRGC